MSYSVQEAAALLDKGRGQKDQILIIMREAWRRARWWHRECLNPWEGDMPPPLDERALQTAEMLSLESASSGDAIDWYDRDPPFEQVWFTSDELARWQCVMARTPGIERQYFGGVAVGDEGSSWRMGASQDGVVGENLEPKASNEWTDARLIEVAEMSARIGPVKTGKHYSISHSRVNQLVKKAGEKGLTPTVTPNVFQSLSGAFHSGDRVA